MESPRYTDEQLRSARFRLRATRIAKEQSFVIIPVPKAAPLANRRPSTIATMTMVRLNRVARTCSGKDDAPHQLEHWDEWHPDDRDAPLETLRCPVCAAPPATP